MECSRRAAELASRTGEDQQMADQQHPEVAARWDRHCTPPLLFGLPTPLPQPLKLLLDFPPAARLLRMVGRITPFPTFR